MAKERDIVETLVELTERGESWATDEDNWYLSRGKCEFLLAGDTGSLTMWYRYDGLRPAEEIDGRFTRRLVRLLQERQPLSKRPEREQILQDAYESLAKDVVGVG